jgi:hypothetical protein
MVSIAGVEERDDDAGVNDDDQRHSRRSFFR